MRWFARLGTLTLSCIVLLQLQGCSPGIGMCPAGDFCVWENQDYNIGQPSNNNDWMAFDFSEADYRFRSWPGTSDSMDNEVSSVANNYRCTVTLYQDPGLQGDQLRVESYASTGNLDGYSVSDNQASGHFIPTC